MTDKCVGTTGSGAACKLNAAADSDFCIHHQSQEEGEGPAEGSEPVEEGQEVSEEDEGPEGPEVVDEGGPEEVTVGAPEEIGAPRAKDRRPPRKVGPEQVFPKRNRRLGEKMWMCPEGKCGTQYAKDRKPAIENHMRRVHGINPKGMK